ncbi:F-box-like protein [Carex littledalei]|uniref:F-box-like protein n=1 Tax=Carex littledalei TaxID=544730 RepID=A0A833R7X5_9POAL|nr:F-box-like protein [Carex littledalei]
MTRPSIANRRRRRGDRSTVRNWSDLPDGPLHTILTCLCSLVDFISFSSVCRSWRAVASSVSTASLFPPLLLCPTFFRFSILSSLSLLDPASPSFSSSLSRNSNKFASIVFHSYSHGHLLRFSQNRIIILNPFTGDELFSPLLPQNRNFFPYFPLLTSPLSSPDSGLLLLTSDTLFHWHINSPSWSIHNPKFKPSGRTTFATVQEKVYALDSLDTLFVLDVSPQLHLRLAVDGLGDWAFIFQRFLVVCDGQLLLLLLVPTDELIYAQLEVYRLDSSVNGTRWVKQQTLGNWAIFVGYDCRVPGLAVENPERWGGRSNCVYFATEYGDGAWPWTVIKLGDVIDTLDPESPLFNAKFRNRPSSAWVHPGF